MPLKPLGQAQTPKLVTTTHMPPLRQVTVSHGFDGMVVWAFVKRIKLSLLLNKQTDVAIRIKRFFNIFSLRLSLQKKRVKVVLIKVSKDRLGLIII